MADRAHSTSRRALLAGLSVTPAMAKPMAAFALSTAAGPGGVAATARAFAAPADPHVARGAEACALYRRHRETDWGWDEPYASPSNREADAAHFALLDLAATSREMPPPTTLAGLGALAFTMALAKEEFTNEGSIDAHEGDLRALIEAVLNVAGVALPADYRGLVYVADASEQAA